MRFIFSAIPLLLSFSFPQALSAPIPQISQCKDPLGFLGCLPECENPFNPSDLCVVECAKAHCEADPLPDPPTEEPPTEPPVTPPTLKQRGLQYIHDSTREKTLEGCRDPERYPSGKSQIMRQAAGHIFPKHYPRITESRRATDPRKALPRGFR
ncbi:hypothetical protein B9Z19DRAFT_1110251 [Tuber borchii]|uniref:Uncharacterized protein n=1 Tax=Tuber borchii TaxID=42251 RepID=A0A2T6ZI45_TUBBO|nr:hypothetical protein B9Z19DRAFT_1110251 [Tuber borchii]